MSIFSRLFPVLVVISIGFTTSACSGNTTSGKNDINMASMSDMPAQVQQAPVSVKEAYQFAAANPEMLKQIPCYCGCGAIGHTSNYACYIAGEDENGGLRFDTHALGCSICVDITQDVMRLMKQGKNAPEIKSYIDQTYSQYGSSNLP